MKKRKQPKCMQLFAGPLKFQFPCLLLCQKLQRVKEENKGRKRRLGEKWNRAKRHEIKSGKQEKNIWLRWNLTSISGSRNRRTQTRGGGGGGRGEFSTGRTMLPETPLNLSPRLHHSPSALPTHPSESSLSEDHRLLSAATSSDAIWAKCNSQL